MSEGCLYKCRFCEVKNNRPFRTRSKSEIATQIESLANLYSEDLYNYNAIFLGDHDALNTEPETLMGAIPRAVEELRLHRSYMQGCSLFLFGSVDSFLQAPENLFQQLNGLNCQIYMNLGLESFDQKTLDRIGKPIRSRQVVNSFRRMVEVNDTYPNIEITANFIMDPSLSDEHYAKFIGHTRTSLQQPRSKGTLYLSPLLSPRAKTSPRRLFEFSQLKRLSRLPCYLYTIQRL